MRRGPTFFIDLGDDASVCSSVYAANLFASAIRETVYFCAPAKFLGRTENFPRVHILSPDSGELNALLESSRQTIDFTEPGNAVVESFLMDVRSDKMHLDASPIGNSNILLSKVEFISECTGMTDLCKQIQARNVSPVLTYSAEMAAVLNMSGIATIELCYKSKKPGSFLPGSLVILGDTFSMLQRDELNMLFEFYHLGKIEDIFVNKSVLETDWDLLYFRMDQAKSTIVSKRYPVSPSESFMDQFFRGFLAPQKQRSFSVDHLLLISQKMDTIDLEMTLDFIKKTLRLCVEDLDTFDESFDGTYWNMVRPYLDCRRKVGDKLRKSLDQALIGLDLFHRIHERSRKVLSMH